MHSSSWDNLRFVLAVAERGSVSSAARKLGVNHATVLRRVAAFEAEQGGPVFEKTATGYRVLPDRARVIEAARDVENAVLSVERLMHGAVAPLRGVVRVSSTDTLCQVLLPPFVARAQSTSTELQIELMSNNSHLDFAKMQADISVRPAKSLPEELVGDRAADMAFAAYCVSGAPKQWLRLTGPLSKSNPATWMKANVEEDDIRGGANSFLALREMALAGLGVTILPTFIGDVTNGLVRHPIETEVQSVPVWVATHADLRDVPRIRIVRKRLQAYLVERRDLLAGRACD